MLVRVLALNYTSTPEVAVRSSPFSPPDPPTSSCPTILSSLEAAAPGVAFQTIIPSLVSPLTPDFVVGRVALHE